MSEVTIVTVNINKKILVIKKMFFFLLNINGNKKLLKKEIFYSIKIGQHNLSC